MDDYARAAAAMILELTDAEGAWERLDADWTEDLFHRSRIYIETLLEQLRTAEAEIAEARAHNAQFEVDHSKHFDADGAPCMVGKSWTTQEARDLDAILSNYRAGADHE